jgi:ribosomal protein L11 methyltransferase
VARSYPALSISGARPDEIDRILALADDFSPRAAEECEGGVRLFFGDAADRDQGRVAVATAFPRMQADPIEVDDEDWARRSQQALAAIRVGRIVVAPPWAQQTSDVGTEGAGSHQLRATGHDAIVITIEPSMGFGTGHHATTRLCLAALQRLDLRHASVLDIGTGSGVLALAADRLGAARALGIDSDADAIQSARENLSRNTDARHVVFEVADLLSATLVPADVVTANLTGALLVRAAATLMHAVRPGGTLVLCGLQASERDDVVTAFCRATLIDEREEDGWVGLTLIREAQATRSSAVTSR